MPYFKSHDSDSAASPELLTRVTDGVITFSELRMNLAEMLQPIPQDLDRDSALVGQMIGFNDALAQVCERMTGSPLSE